MPAKPYPYREEQVVYENKSAVLKLAATLTIPQGKGPFTAVLLLTGSGPQDRDESVLEHKPFLVLADYLTRKGIAVLRADDRGTGKSGGTFDQATSADFATDAEAGLEYLKTRAEINPRKLGLVGHSEGGLIASMVAARDLDVAFIVMMASPGVRGDLIVPAQVAAVAESGGQRHAEAEMRANEQRDLLALVEHESDDEIVEQKLRNSGARFSHAQLEIQLKQYRSPWFQFFLNYDPATALQRVKCPVLAVNGEMDRQVLPDQNLPAIRKALEAGGNQHFQVEELPGLNHLFQTAKTGSPAEYGLIEETLSPLVLDRVSGWIQQQ